MPGHSQELCISLKMQNNHACYKRMRVDILTVAKKFLNHEAPCSSQVKAVEDLRAELIKKWPDFFGGDSDGSATALKCAMSYIRQQHSTTRSKRNLCKRTTVAKKPGASRARSVARGLKKSNRVANIKVLVKQEQPTHPDLTSTQSTLVERMSRNLEYYASQVQPSTPAESSGPTVPITPAPSGPNRALRPCVELTTSRTEPKFVTTTKDRSKTTTTPLPTRLNTLKRTQHSQSISEPTSSPPHASSSQGSQLIPCPFGSTRSMPSPMASTSHMDMQSIHQFLRTCLPPMEHFLHRFINAGLRTEEGLLGVSRWQRELIESFVNQLPPHPDGSPVLLMEKLVLIHQFATYFL